MRKLSKIVEKFDYRIIQYVLTVVFLYLNAREIVHWPIHVILLPLYGPVLIISVLCLGVALVSNTYDFISKKIKYLIKKYSKQKVYEKDIELIKTKEKEINNNDTKEEIKENNKLDLLRKEREKLLSVEESKQKTYNKRRNN